MQNEHFKQKIQVDWIKHIKRLDSKFKALSKGWADVLERPVAYVNFIHLYLITDYVKTVLYVNIGNASCVLVLAEQSKSCLTCKRNCFYTVRRWQARVWKESTRDCGTELATQLNIVHHWSPMQWYFSYGEVVRYCLSLNQLQFIMIQHFYSMSGGTHISSFSFKCREH